MYNYWQKFRQDPWGFFLSAFLIVGTVSVVIALLDSTYAIFNRPYYGDGIVIDKYYQAGGNIIHDRGVGILTPKWAAVVSINGETIPVNLDAYQWGCIEKGRRVSVVRGEGVLCNWGYYIK